jgi:hypothetical protein
MASLVAKNTEEAKNNGGSPIACSQKQINESFKQLLEEKFPRSSCEIHKILIIFVRNENVF